MDQNNFGGIDEILKYLGYDKSTGGFNFDQSSFQNNNRSGNTSNANEDKGAATPSDLNDANNSTAGSRRRYNNSRKNNNRNFKNNADSAIRMHRKSSSESGGNNTDRERYKVDIDPTGGAASNCCINQNLDIPCGFQDINPTVFVILAEVIGDLLSGQLPFNIANVVANWLNLIGQIIETYSTQQVYSEAGPGRYYSPVYKNVANPFCSCTEVSSDSNGSGTTGASYSSGQNASAGSTGGNNSQSATVNYNNSNNTSSSDTSDTEGNGNSKCDSSNNDTNSNNEIDRKNNNTSVLETNNLDTEASNVSEAEHDENSSNNRENLKKSIERIDDEISYMKEQFAIFNKKMEELKRNMENIK